MNNYKSVLRSIILSILIFCFPLISVHGQGEKNLDIVFISGSNEYVSHITLKEYKKTLEKKYPNVKVTILQADGPINEKGEYSNLNGTDALSDCDVVLIFVRRTTISGKAIEDIRKYLDSGKPLVAIRTSSHGLESWPEFDQEILGGNYQGHYGGSPEKRQIGVDGVLYPVGAPTGPTTAVSVDSENKNHPVLENMQNFVSKYSLYKTTPLAGDAKILLMGTTMEGEAPVAWTRNNRGGKIVYTSLGGVQDWENPFFVKFVTNSLFWASGFKGKEN